MFFLPVRISLSMGMFIRAIGKQNKPETQNQTYDPSVRPYTMNERNLHWVFLHCTQHFCNQSAKIFSLLFFEFGSILDIRYFHCFFAVSSLGGHVCGKDPWHLPIIHPLPSTPTDSPIFPISKGLPYLTPEITLPMFHVSRGHREQKPVSIIPYPLQPINDTHQSKLHTWSSLLTQPLPSPLAMTPQ